MSEDKKPLWGKCDECGVCWPVLYVPMELTIACKIMQRAICPNCGNEKVLVAWQANGVLMEPQSSTAVAPGEN